MAKDYSKLEKEDLLKVIEKIESRKKYGLIWDEEKTKEKFEKESENALPVLKEVKGKEIKTDSAKPTNILIEGDNYHALSVLNYTHQGKVDVIYIDPPYNTGNKDFKYNDRFIDREDSYRHSKWLSFMSKRLRLAKNLLTDEGVIFISIGDDEVAQLKILCDEIFGPDNFIANIVRRRRGSQANLSKNMNLVNTNQNGSSLSLPAHGRAGARATSSLAARFAKRNTKFGGCGKARAGKNSFPPTPFLFARPSLIRQLADQNSAFGAK